MRRLREDFFQKPTLEFAQELLGKCLVRKVGKKKIIGRIVEVEAYCGPHDRASHASRGKTKRTEIMFGRAGHLYVYMIYGMYYCLNIVTEPDGFPAAVLIRAVEPIENQKLEIKNKKHKAKVKNIATGPGKVCQWLNVDRSFNKENLLTSERIWLADCGRRIQRKHIVSASRVGVSYAGPYWARRKWRFYIKGNAFVSARFRKR